MHQLHAEPEARSLTASDGPAAALRVLHVYAGNLYGGIESLLVTLARQQAACPGLCHDYALCFEGRLSEELREAGVPVHVLGPARVSRPWTVWRARGRLAALLARTPYDLVVCHACWPHALFAPVVRRARRPLVFWAHEALSGRHWLERWARRTPPDQIVANSRSTAASLPPLFGNVPVEVQYCPVTPPPQPGRANLRHRIREEQGVPPDTVVLLQISRLERLKGQSVLVEALARLADLPGWLCWFVGGPQRPHEARYLEELQAATRTAGLTDRVRFLGQRADIQQLLAAADIYCQPNVGPDSFGITFVEALYAGLPVVTSRLGGAVEIVEESCGFLLAPGDAGALAATLHALIQQPLLRAHLGEMGPERARQLCDPPAVLERLRQQLAAVVSKR